MLSTPHFYPINFTHGQFMRFFSPYLLIISAALCVTSQAHAQDIDWWFDIEVVIFKRNIDVSTITEQFAHTAPKFADHNAVDLLSDYIQPNLDYLYGGLAICSQGEEPKPSKASSRDLHLDNTVFQLNKDMALAEAQITSEKASEPFPVKTDQIDDTLTIANQNVSIAYTWQKVHWQFPTELPCVFARDKVLLEGPYEHPITRSMAKRVPVEIDGIFWPERFNPSLLPKDYAELDALVKRIDGQRDLSLILHLTWRQPVVFGRSKAVPMKLIAGANYADVFSQSGWRKPTTLSNMGDLTTLVSAQEPDNAETATPRDLFTEIELALQDKSPFTPNALDTPLSQRVDEEEVNPLLLAEPVVEKPLWQLEGAMKIYLQNVGRTPYLHIDSDLDFRLPIKRDQPTSTPETQNDFLQSYNFNQLRRVISTQLHYFDHPLFGMVVQIRRYEPPPPLETAETAELDIN
ncbi:MAG: hypothetical protein ACI9C4_000248 [Paraglaciecola sp.]|jgi:hypothetical protein